MTAFAAHRHCHSGFHRMTRKGYGHHYDPRTFWRGAGFGPGGGGRRSRARRGDVRAAILLLLEGEPRNGYRLMEEIESRSEGVWRPSPGSVYPALAQLEDEGLIRADESAGRRSFALTDEGRQYVAENREALGSPWDEAGRDLPTDVVDVRDAISQVAMATAQVMRTGDEEQIAEAKEILTAARKSLYRLLADAE